MFRYRCPHCGHVLQSLEIRAGKTTVCAKCSQPLAIPADRSEWLNERGEPLLASPTVRIPAVPAELTVAPGENPADADVLGAIFIGLDAGVSPTGGPMTSGPKTGGPPSFAEQPSPEPEPPAWDDTPHPAPAALTQAEHPAPEPPESEPAPDAWVPEVAAAPAIPPDPDPEPEPTFTPAPVRRPTHVPAHEPRPVPHPVATVTTPAPRTLDRAHTHEPHPGRGRLVATLPAPPRRPEPDPESVSFNEPLHLRSQMDIAAELTAALTSRMKPPPEPPRDLSPATALWLIATGVAVALLVLTLFGPTDFGRAVAFIGLGEIVAGYAWVVWIAARRDWQRGLLCAIPPATIWFLTRRKYARYRPLRFVATGAILIIAAWAAGYARPHTRGLFTFESPSSTVTPADSTTDRRLVRLNAARDHRDYPTMLALLEDLDRTDPEHSGDAPDRSELSRLLRELCTDRDSAVRVKAMPAYVRWAVNPDDALKVCLDALRSQNQDERVAALQLLPQWKGDDNVALAIGSRIGRPGVETDTAVKSLIAVGGRSAEQTAVSILWDDRRTESDRDRRLSAISILKSVASPSAAAELRRWARAPQFADDAATQTEADRTAEFIENLIKSK